MRTLTTPIQYSSPTIRFNEPSKIVIAQKLMYINDLMKSGRNGEATMVLDALLDELTSNWRDQVTFVTQPMHVPAKNA